MARTMMMLAVGALLLAASANAQPFTFTPGPYQPELTEAAQRAADNYTGFVYDFKKGGKTDGGTPNGSLRANQVSQNPFLTSLPGRGNGQTIVTLGPCAGNTPHTHPRGSEISYLTYGEIKFGMVDENFKGKNKLVLRTLKQGQTIHIPQGIIHFSQNHNCKPAQFLANFGERDPGTQTVWNSMMQIPNAFLNQATGIPESTFTELKKYPLVVAPGTGGEECLKKCNIDFQTANKFEE